MFVQELSLINRPLLLEKHTQGTTYWCLALLWGYERGLNLGTGESKKPPSINEVSVMGMCFLSF